MTKSPKNAFFLLLNRGRLRDSKRLKAKRQVGKINKIAKTDKNNVRRRPTRFIIKDGAADVKRFRAAPVETPLERR